MDKGWGQEKCALNNTTIFFSSFQNIIKHMLCITPFHHPPFHHFIIAPFYQCPVQSLLFTPKSLLFAPISRANWVSTCGTAHGARGKFPCVARRRLQLCLWCYPGLQFNLLAWSLILDTSPVPVPAGGWVAELRGSSVSRTSQRR